MSRIGVNMKKILIICGPTGVGKTKLGLHLARKFNGEIISADSRQVYKGLNILTAKDLSNQVPTYLIDAVMPHEEFSVSSYCKLAKAKIDDILSRKKLPIIVGGTGFYIKALIDGLDTLDIPPRKDLRKKYQSKTREELLMVLTNLNPQYAASLNKSEQHNKQRLIRKIEILQAGPHKASKSSPYDTLFIGLTAPKYVLQKRISNRVNHWMSGGAQKEARYLLENKISNQAATTIALPAWEKYFTNKVSKNYVAEFWKTKDWQYAKRQITWFKKNKKINWYDIANSKYPENVDKLVKNWYHNNIDATKN